MIMLAIVLVLLSLLASSTSAQVFPTDNVKRDAVARKVAEAKLPKDFPLMFRANGTPVSSVFGRSQRPKLIIDTLTFNGGTAVLRLNSNLNGNKHRTMPTAENRIKVLSVEPSNRVKYDSLVMVMSSRTLILYRTGTDTVKADIFILIQ